MNFRPGDGRVTIQGRSYILRLTLGGLAELDHCLGLRGPLALAQKLRCLQPAEGRVLLECLMHPFLPTEDVKPPVASLSDHEVMHLMPEVCRVFETAFGETL